MIKQIEDKTREEKKFKLNDRMSPRKQLWLAHTIAIRKISKL
jgi:hypothetical protein